MSLTSAQSRTRSRVAMIALMALTAIGAAGCTPDQGKQGAQGPPGPVGPPGGSGGGTGPTGPTGIEQGANVSLGDGTALTAEQIKSIGTLVATIDKVSLTTATAVRNPVIEFTLKTPYGGAVTDLAPSVLSVRSQVGPAAGGKSRPTGRAMSTAIRRGSGPKPSQRRSRPTRRAVPTACSSNSRRRAHTVTPTRSTSRP